MSALPHPFKPTLADVEGTSSGQPLLLFCAAINIEQDMESDERLAAKPGYNPSVQIPTNAASGDGEAEEQQANVGGVKQGGGGVCTFRVPLERLEESCKNEPSAVKMQDDGSESN